MTTLSADTHRTSHVQNDFGYGMLAGMIGGACFGFLMQATGLMATYAGIVEGKDIDAWFIHILISAALGAIYGAAAYRISKSWAVSGIVYGLIWWVVGGLILLPLLSSVPEFGVATWWDLLGNIIFGLVTAGIFSATSRD